MVVAESDARLVRPIREGVWEWKGWGGPRVRAGIADRRLASSHWLAQRRPSVRMVSAGQVHGSSIAFIDRMSDQPSSVDGCDALLCRIRGLALLVRTADCLPIFLYDPRRGAIGIAHAGWRGLAAQLPLRLLAAFRHYVHSDPADLRVALGPAIHACCYDVSPPFAQRFEPFMERREGRLTCDLIAAASQQFRDGGVPPAHLLDSQQCTACRPDSWYSVRREGDATGRMASFIMLQP